MNELALFAGAGGGILGGILLGWRTVCAVEINRYAASVLVARQNDGHLSPFPVWDDIRTFDGRPWKGIVEVISGGFPCQDISAAGKGAGIEGERSGLWSEFARIIREVQPKHVFVENSPMLTSRGIHRVLGDLAEMGFDARWGVLGAVDVGAPHIRKRVWIVADSQEECSRRISGDTTTKGTLEVRESEPERGEPFSRGHEQNRCSKWFETEPKLGRVAHGVADRVDRLEAIGNGQVPACAALAWKILSRLA